MTNRIRKKVELIRQCGANPSDNLSELDLKIHEMSPTGDYDEFDDFDLNSATANGNVNDCDLDVPDDTVVTEEIEILKDEMDLENIAGGDSGRILVVRTSEELEAYMNEPMIEEDVDPEELQETISRSSFTNANIRDAAEEFEELMDEPITIQDYSDDELITIQDYPEKSNVTHRPPSSQTNNGDIGKVRGQHTRPMQSRLTAPQKSSTKSLKPNKSTEAAQVSCLILRF